MDEGGKHDENARMQRHADGEEKRDRRDKMSKIDAIDEIDRGTRKRGKSDLHRFLQMRPCPSIPHAAAQMHLLVSICK